jgi:hypothetical protein
MNNVGTEIYGDRKQTDRLTGEDVVVISGLSHFFSVQRSDGSYVTTSRHISHRSITTENES